MKSTATVKLIRSISDMRAFSREARKKQKKIGLVPTLGGIHEGHLSLVKAAKKLRKRCDLVVVSIFVNPLQFAPHEDLASYPRDLEGDLEKLQKLGVDAVFAPEASEMFPSGYRTFVEVDEFSRRLCGRSRPAHFRGVTTVVFKLFQIIDPAVALFGQKDYQQLVLVRKMVKDLNLEVEILDRPTVYEKDGLAMSTRNAYLTEEQRVAALALPRALEVAEKLVLLGERNSSIIISNMREVVRSVSGADLEYIAICSPETLSDLEAVEQKTLFAVAIRVGKARLIDNLYVDLVKLDRKEKQRKARSERAKAAKAKAPKRPAKKR